MQLSQGRSQQSLREETRASGVGNPRFSTLCMKQLYMKCTKYTTVFFVSGFDILRNIWISNWPMREKYVTSLKWWWNHSCFSLVGCQIQMYKQQSSNLQSAAYVYIYTLHITSHSKFRSTDWPLLRNGEVCVQWLSLLNSHLKFKCSLSKAPPPAPVKCSN